MSIDRALTFGTLPFIQFCETPWDDLRNYVSDYVREEVVAEGLTRKVDQFARFLETAAITHTQVLNFESVARDAQVPARTVRDYYAILHDTLFGEMLYPWAKAMRRKPTAHGKFYFFDICVPHALLKIRELVRGTQAFAVALEHLVYRELATYRDYRQPDLQLNFYRDTAKREIDFLLDGKIGIEVKSTPLVGERDIRHLVQVGNELGLRRRIVVSRDLQQRRIGNVEIFPVADFLAALWAGDFATS